MAVWYAKREALHRHSKLKVKILGDLTPKHWPQKATSRAQERQNWVIDSTIEENAESLLSIDHEVSPLRPGESKLLKVARTFDLIILDLDLSLLATSVRTTAQATTPLSLKAQRLEKAYEE